VAARPDVSQARDFIHQNPASALAPLPLVLPLTPAPSALPTPVPSGLNVSLDEQRRVLMKRRGSVVGRRSILKSYHQPPPPPGRARSGASPLLVEGVSDVRHVQVGCVWGGGGGRTGADSPTACRCSVSSTGGLSPPQQAEACPGLGMPRSAC
jgi:hypothetical protein